jgi:enterobactin synthetase component D
VSPLPATSPAPPDRAGHRAAAAGLGLLITARLRELQAELDASGLGQGVACVAEPHLSPAGPGEASAVASMPPRRRREFLAGRLAARRALRAVGLDCGDIPRAGRLPLFPPGRAASISHSAGVAVAVARAPGRDTPLGCDLELRPLPAGAARLVLREDEEEVRCAVRPGGAPWSVTALFSAKEAAWKALHTGQEALARGELRSLRDLRARPCLDGLRIEARTAAAPAVHVRVITAGPGVFSTVLGRPAH